MLRALQRAGLLQLLVLQLTITRPQLLVETSVDIPVRFNGSFYNGTIRNVTTGVHSTQSGSCAIGLRIAIGLVRVFGNLCLLIAAWKDRNTCAGTRLLIINIAVTSLLIVGTGYLLRFLLRLFTYLMPILRVYYGVDYRSQLG